MAVTLEQIAGFLESRDVDYKHDKEGDVIISGFGHEGNFGMLFIRARENGDLFSLQMEPQDDNKDAIDPKSTHEHIGVLLPQLLYFNYQTKFGTWEYDPSDGDLRFAIEIPLEDAQMTQTQFDRIMTMVGTNLEYIGTIKHILKTGEVPEDESMEEFSEIMSDFMKFLEEQKKGGKKGGDSEGI